jgi:hypothetical protein
MDINHTAGNRMPSQEHLNFINKLNDAKIPRQSQLIVNRLFMKNFPREVSEIIDIILANMYHMLLLLFSRQLEQKLKNVFKRSVPFMMLKSLPKKIRMHQFIIEIVEHAFVFFFS